MRVPSVALGLVLLLSAVSAGAEEAARPRAGLPPVSSEREPWWVETGDPHLSALMDEALRRNHDIASALARIEAAEARVTQATAPLLPSLSLDATVAGQPAASLGFQFGGLRALSGGAPGMPGAETSDDDEPEVVVSTSAMVSLRYQVDLWGRAVEGRRAARLLRDATEADSRSVALALSIQVGQAYYDLVAAREQAALLERQVELNRSLVDVMRLRYAHDLARASDLLQQRQQLAAARARRTLARTALRVAAQRLALLLARDDWRGLAGMEAIEALPELGPPLRPEALDEVVERRPEVVAARRRVEASERQSSSARRALLPTLGLSASAGYQGFDWTEYREQSTWNVGVTLSVPAFRGLADWAAVREARANLSAARHALEQARLRALSDLRGALETEAEQREQLQAYRDQLEAARQAFEVARDAYLGGTGSYLSMMAALGALEAAELTELQSRRAVIDARLRLIQALGGHWLEALWEDRSER